jgi:NAD(P)-dependent dehydrogenase (short-subunit alcohol dehydrogenase family)
MFGKGAFFVAGGSGGLGSAICRKLAEYGAPVMIGYHSNADGARELRDACLRIGGKASIAEVDLNENQSVDAALASTCDFGNGLAGTVYAAGVGRHFDFISRIPLEQWTVALNGDTLACIRLAHLALPHLRSSRGAFLAVSTYQGAVIEPRGSLSSVPKAAIERFVAALAREEGRSGVRANVVRAGWIQAGTGRHLMDDPEVLARKKRKYR